MNVNLNPGDQLGDWVIVRALGAGGMGSVFLAHSVLATDVTSALKVLTPGGSADFESRFVQELRTLSALRHPAIVGVRGGGRDEKRKLLYMAMELIDGEDLADRLERGALSSDEAARIFGPVADALAYAHRKGVAHRDLKPANIMLRADGSPVIVDFGIAVTEGQTRHTREGMVPGTMVYLPPEIFSGAPPDPFSTDAYALGVVMWEALTGAAPFQADQNSTGGAAMAQIMGQKLRSEALDPGEVASDELREVIRRSTDPEPDTRLIDFDVIRATLSTSDGLAPLSTLNVPRPRPASQRTSRRPTTQIAVAGAGGALVLLAAGIVLLTGIIAVIVAVVMLRPEAPSTTREIAPLEPTLDAAARALEAGDMKTARVLTARAIDSHPEDPSANLAYGQALVLDERVDLARPFLCAAVDAGFEDGVPGLGDGSLDCTRGPGASEPLDDPVAVARLDLDHIVAAASKDSAVASRDEGAAPPLAPQKAEAPGSTAPSSPSPTTGTADATSKKRAARDRRAAEAEAAARSSEERARREMTAAEDRAREAMMAAEDAEREALRAERRRAAATELARADEPEAPAPEPAPVSQSPARELTARLVSPPSITGELSDRQSSVRKRFDSQLAKLLKSCDPSLGDPRAQVMGLTYTFRIAIWTNGSSVPELRRGAGPDDFSACALKQMRSWTFEKDYGGRSSLNFSIVLE